MKDNSIIFYSFIGILIAVLMYFSGTKITIKNASFEINIGYTFEERGLK